MNDFFDNPRAFAPFESEVVVVCKETDASADVMRATVRATVIVGRGVAESAGSNVGGETAGEATVSVVSSAWPFRFEPRFGMSILTGSEKLTVKEVDRTEWGWTMVCTFDEREADR